MKTPQGALTDQPERHDLSYAAVMAALANRERLAALRAAELLDATPDQQLDRLTRLAARTLRAPMAVISVVDDRRNLCKSMHGWPEPWASRREWPLSHSYCQYVVALGEPLIIGDARQHPLVHRSPAIRDLSAIAYAGVPVSLAGRHVVGTLAALDSQPRPWASDELEVLRELAGAVIEVIEAHTDAHRLRTIIAAIPDAVLACDAQGHVLAGTGSRAARFFGLPQGQSHATAESVTHAPLVASDGTRVPPERHPLARALRGERVVAWQGNVPLTTEEDRWRPVVLDAAPIRGPDDAIEGAVVISTALDQVGGRTEDPVHEKDEFLTLVSHELKTPLTSLKMQTQMTLRRLSETGALSASQMARMQRAVARMERLINSLMESSRIQSHALELDVATCDLHQICVAAAAEQQEAVGRPIELDLPDEACVVRCDADRVEQVLDNLLSNAVKYTLPGHAIRLELRCGQNEAEVYVRDQGTGIPPEVLPHLFERFYRAPQIEVQTGSQVGLGLGLFISRQIIERHGGRMWVESSVGSGSTFAFALPLEPAPAAPPRGTGDGVKGTAEDAVAGGDAAEEDGAGAP